ncbi:BTB/POZ domain containing protein [Pandoravirus quercus]|uniref:BTB/POZ domain containing protein n=2 Tax=Pandoravirus TaxID=2060084 RepID=A0A2U7U8Z3_9VIRU|nr:BTB/POZ domain containing protein [Pandoravirus quercus]AVK74899.1 BTB/POZ domain containing protein [Pandoravirus quercus]QBZ81085.1 BTB domain containing protein [Pandoravirus celtis]
MDTDASKTTKDQHIDAQEPGQDKEEIEVNIASHAHDHEKGDNPTDVSPESRLITLNVGGEKMVTSRTTFAAAPAGSLLAQMFGPDADPQWTPPRLADGSYFMDLNPRHFAVVLDVLRHGPAMLYPLSPADRGAVTLVADYLGIDLAASCFANDVLRYRAMAVAESERLMILGVSPSAFWNDCLDLCDWSASSIKATYVPAIGSWTLAEARDVLSSAMGIPSDRMVAHVCLHRRNGTVRPVARLPMDSATVRLNDVQHLQRRALVLIVHHETFLTDVGALPVATVRPRPSALTPLQPASGRRSLGGTMVQPTDGPVLIFVRCFDRAKESLSKARPVLVNAHDAIVVAVPAMCALLELSSDQHVHLFEEVSIFMIVPVDPTSTFSDAEIGYGDILWLEAVPVSESAATPRPIDRTLIDRFAHDRA